MHDLLPQPHMASGRRWSVVAKYTVPKSRTTEQTGFDVRVTIYTILFSLVVLQPIRPCDWGRMGMFQHVRRMAWHRHPFDGERMVGNVDR